MSALLWWCDFTYTICRVTLPTERVSWNVLCFIDERIYCCHAPHGACELKLALAYKIKCISCHAPHGACELKSCCAGVTPEKHSHAPHGACELKLSFHRYSRYNTKLRSPRSVWVEIVCYHSPRWIRLCYAPHGACELKLIWDLILWQTIHVTLPTERVSWNDYDELEKIMREVTLPTERVNWNLETNWGFQYSRCHAPHGACEWGVEVPSYTK